MNSSNKEKAVFRYLLDRSLDGQITVEEILQLEALLSTYPDLENYYIQCVQSQFALHEVQIASESHLIEEPILEKQFWEDMSIYEKTAPTIEIPQEHPQRELIQHVERPALGYQKKLSKWDFAILVTSAAAVVFMILFVRFAPVRNTYHGQIIDTWQAVFAGSTPSLQPSGYLKDEMIKLEKGLVRIQMDDGSFVLLEAPAELRLEGDDQVFLIRGKLTADVPKSGIGFTVRTPSASIVDYGTKFGVSIDPYAKTEAHVLRGNVEMRLGSNLRVFEKAIRLSANQAGSVSGQTLMLIPAKVDQFTYEIPSPFERYARSLNPLLYFRLKENDIHTFSDVTEKSGIDILMEPNLQITSGPALSNDRLTYALRMDGERGVQVQGVLPLFASGSGDFTVACWVRLDHIQKQIIWSNRVIDNPDHPADSAGYYRVLWVNDDGRLEHTAYFPEREPSRQHQNVVRGAADLKPAQWYFVAVTHAKGGYKSLYINGKPAGRSSRLQDVILEKYSELTFGQPVKELAPGLSGAISEILFFNRDLTDGENQMLYESALEK